MKSRILCSAMLLMSIVSFGQFEAKIESEGVVPGVIIRGGKEIAGYIKKMGETYHGTDMYAAPWEFQKDFKFMEKTKFESLEKIKNKDYETVDAKDTDGYRYSDSVAFSSVKYSDMSAVGTGMIAKKMFMRKIKSEGKVTIYNFYSAPSIDGTKTVSEAYAEAATPTIVYQIGEEGKLKQLAHMNVAKELADCPEVVQKHERNEYKAVGKAENNSGMNKFLNQAIFRDEVRWLALQDYIATCK